MGGLFRAAALFWAAVFFLAGSPEAHGELQRTFRLIEGLRINLRKPKPQITHELTTRAEVDLSCQRWWKVMPLVETRRDYDNGVWSRIEAGAELGWQPVSWAYLGNAVHQAWRDPGPDRPEWEIRSVFTLPLWGRIRGEKPLFYFLNEYTYDLEDGRPHRNEIASGFLVPLPLLRLKTQLGWRHVDIIGEPDMDQAEAALHLEF